MSTVMMKIVKQLSINVNYRYNIYPDQIVLRTVKAFCRKVASRSWRNLFFSEANNTDS